MSRSDYYSTLTGDVKARYDKKLEIIDDIDPYSLSESDLSKDLNIIPLVSLMDLVNYLILTHSFYTGQQLKAYKSLLAYKYYESGYVQEVFARQMNENAYIVVGKVRHSQKTREKLLKVWLILLSDGAVSSGHCTCMAGLGEVCSHVAALLFCLQARPAENQDLSVSCTQKLAQWPVPSTKSIDMVRIRDIDWLRKEKETVSVELVVPGIEKEDFIQMIRSIQNIGISPAIARVTEPFASENVRTSSQDLPISLDSFFDEDLVGATYNNLLKKAQMIKISITAVQIDTVEAETRNQALSNLWYKYRSGRITASKFKMVCRTCVNKPSLSLIKGICYPEKVVFFSKPTSYGIKNEKNALKAYIDAMKKSHQKVSLRNIGFCISQENPEFGASPDGIVDCECCGSGCVEVKCPYLLTQSTLEEYSNKKNSCIINNDGQYSLDRNHMYYYQVQLQMYVTKHPYCDFVLWSKNCLVIDRIQYDNQFCLENISKGKDFFNFVIMPELLGKYFTLKGGMSEVVTWCTCNGPDDGTPMLKCDNDDCHIEWYHLKCVGLVGVPEIWLCPSCTD